MYMHVHLCAGVYVWMQMCVHMFWCVYVQVFKLNIISLENDDDDDDEINPKDSFDHRHYVKL